MILFYILSVLWAAACITTLLLGCIVLIMFSEYGRENLDYKTGLIAVKWFFLPPVAVIKIVNMRLEHHDAKSKK